MRIALAAVMFCATSFAQDVADPGRRLSPEEIKRLDSETQPAPQNEPVPNLNPPAKKPRDPAACDRARTNYLIWCRAPTSRQSYSRSCAEANDLYLKACEP